MIQSSVVRLATPVDRKECWRLLMQAHTENGIFELSSTRVNWWLDIILEPNNTRGAIAVIGAVGRLEALCFIVFGQYWYSDQRHLEEFIVYVDPECRKSNHAKALVNWMKEQSEATGLPLVTGIMSNTRTEAKVRLYERMLPKVGAFFLWNPKGSGSYAVASSS